MLGSVLVPMPLNKISRKKIGDSVYIYHVIRSFRGSNGKPRPEVKAIGKLDAKTGMLIPNNAYYTFYPDYIPTVVKKLTEPCFEDNIDNNIQKNIRSNTQNISNTVIEDITNNINNYNENSNSSQLEYGHVYALQTIADNIGLTSILQQCFPESWNEILTVAMYMVTDGNIISGITDWCEESKISLIEKLTDQMCSCLFTYLDFNQRMNFFNMWIKHITESDYIVYDVTSISTYSENNPDAEFGYNRDGEKLPQINFGMFYAKTSGLPVFYNEYLGNINDVSDLQYMLENTTHLGIKKVDFVLDKGFASDDNLKYMWENKFNFIIPLPSNWKDITHILENNINDVHKYSNWIHKYEIYGIKINYKLGKIPLYAHIFFDTEKYNIAKKAFNEKVLFLEKKLKNFQLNKKIPKHFFDYFDIEVKSPTNHQFKYAINNEKLSQRSKYAGYFIYLTTNPLYSPEELIKTYKTRDFIEKCFMNFKDDIYFKRIRTHNKRTTAGKLFVGFISLILRTELLHRIKKCEKTSNLTLKEVLRKLKRIMITSINGHLIKHMPISKQQREIFDSVGIMLEDFFSSIKKT